MNNLRDFALSMIANSGIDTNNPQAKMIIEAIQNNDAKAGEQLANQLLQEKGMDKGQAIRDARSFFNF